MSNEQRIQEVYKCLVDFLQKADFKFDRHDDEKVVVITLTGDDFPVRLVVSVLDSQRIEIHSQLPFTINKDKGVDIAMACAFVNNMITCGKFSVDFDDNTCEYTASQYFTGLEGFNPDYAKKVFGMSFSIVDDYNDQLYAINKGLLTVKEFMAKNK